MIRRRLGYVLGTIGFVIVLLASLGKAPEASELLYQPINPSFGGNPFNSPHLIGLADRQNKYADNGSRSSGITGLSGRSQGDLFVRSLTSRLLSGLAGQVTEALFGDTPQEEGTIVFGDVTVEFNRGLEFIALTITDASTGSVTEVSVPILETAP